MVAETRRPVAPGAEKFINYVFGVEDVGTVTLMDYMGTDTCLVTAARHSLREKSKGAEADRGLIRYLIRERHTSPVEMAEAKFFVQCPIFIARQWLRHRTANVNEMSGRYTEMPVDCYLPRERMLSVQGTMKQGCKHPMPDEEKRKNLHAMMRVSAQNARRTYEHLLSDDIAKEQARMILPLGTMTEFVWKIDLHNLLHFIDLRLDAHAQYEIRVMAAALAEIVKQWVPVTYEAFSDFRLAAVTVSPKAAKLIRDAISGNIHYEGRKHYDLGRSEWEELHDMMGLDPDVFHAMGEGEV